MSIANYILTLEDISSVTLVIVSNAGNSGIV